MNIKLTKDKDYKINCNYYTSGLLSLTVRMWYLSRGQQGECTLSTEL